MFSVASPKELKEGEGFLYDTEDVGRSIPEGIESQLWFSTAYAWTLSSIPEGIERPALLYALLLHAEVASPKELKALNRPATRSSTLAAVASPKELKEEEAHLIDAIVNLL